MAARKRTLACNFLAAGCLLISFCGSVFGAPAFEKEKIARLQAAIDNVAAEKSMRDDFCRWYADQSIVTAILSGSRKTSEQELLDYIARANAAFARLGSEFSEAHQVAGILFAAKASDPASQSLVASYAKLTKLCPEVGL